MVHSEAENIALRKTVRKDRQDLTTVHPVPYDGKRHKKLDLLDTTLIPTPRRPALPGEPILIEPPGEPHKKTFVVKTFMVGNGCVFPTTFRMRGRFKITHISFFQEGTTTQRTYWGLSSNPSAPTTFAGWLFTRRIFPDSYVNVENDLPEMFLPNPIHFPMAHTIFLSYQALVLCLFYDGPQGGDNYITHTLTVENSPG